MSFLIDTGEIMEAVSQMMWITTYGFHLNPPLTYRPVQAGAGVDGPILRL